MAIGRDGQNVRLAWKLTGIKIDIVGAQGEEAQTVENPVEEEKKDAVEEYAQQTEEEVVDTTKEE